MDTRDLGLAMRTMGALITDKEVDMLIKKYDPSRTGYIAITDFNSCMAEVQGKPDGIKNIESAFGVFDKYDEN